MKGSRGLRGYQIQKMVSSGTPPQLTEEGSDDRWWDLRTLGMTAEMDLGAPISSMELAHGGGTLSVTSGSKVHFLDILRYVLDSLLSTLRSGSTGKFKKRERGGK